ncbi:hypothetical protein PspLS_11657 [Pyricularia sp. CBS 133598]|nr:hypothetical protein PspLS_11657 [Pyricularia sp. CBS 133598]
MKSTLQRNSELLTEAKQTATMRMTHENQETLEKANLLLSQLRTARDSNDTEQRAHRLREVNNRLAPAPYLDDQNTLQSQIHSSATGDWIFADSKFASWADFGDEAHKVLFLNGCPRATATIGRFSNMPSKL